MQPPGGSRSAYAGGLTPPGCFTPGRAAWGIPPSPEHGADGFGEFIFYMGRDADEAELRQTIEAQTRSALQKEYEEKLQKLNTRMDGTTWRMQTLIDLLQSTWEQILSTLDDCANAETALKIQNGLRAMLRHWQDGLHEG